MRLFLLGQTLSEGDLALALGSLDADALRRAGWLEHGDGGMRAAVKFVPHGDLLIVSESDRAGRVDADWVAGIHPPSVTLAKLTVRRQVARALDVGAGNGIQALLASRHADTVVATDVNSRALSIAALNAHLNGVSNTEFRRGSYFEPAAGERFDLITCNPPYVISPEKRYAYRDSGLVGDAVSRQVVEHAAQHLNEGGFAQILINWAHPPDDWWTTLARWVEDRGCDSWLLRFGSDDPISYAAGWLRPVAHEDSDRFRHELGRWLDYLAGLGIEAIAHGAVILRRRRSAQVNWTRWDDVPLDRLAQASEHVQRVFDTQDYLDRLDDGSCSIPTSRSSSITTSSRPSPAATAPPSCIRACSPSTRASASGPDSTSTPPTSCNSSTATVPSATRSRSEPAKWDSIATMPPVLRPPRSRSCTGSFSLAS